MALGTKKPGRLRCLLLQCLILSLGQLSSAAFLKFNEIHISGTLWKPTQSFSNIRSSLQCGVKCATGYDCTAFCYDEALQKCQVGRKGPMVKATNPADNITCFELPGNFKFLIVTGKKTDGTPSNGTEIVNIETSTLSPAPCPPVPEFPQVVYGSAGTLIQKKTPLVCSGHPDTKSCYLLKNNAWGITGSLKQSRYHAAMLPNSPYQNPDHQAIIIGGLDAVTMEVFNGTSWSVIGPSFDMTKLGASCAVYTDPTTVFIISGIHGANLYSKDTYYLNSFEQRWVPGPKVITGRFGHACARIPSTQNGVKQSTIIVGGTTNIIGRLDVVEILDDGSDSWRLGPTLPVKPDGPAMFVDPRGGVIVVGGAGNSGNLYRLRHAGPNAQWEMLVPKSQLALFFTVAIPIPDEIAIC